jgi:hypothetical protein
MSKKTVLVSKLKKMLGPPGAESFTVKATLHYLRTLSGKELEEFLGFPEVKQLRIGSEYGLQCILRGEKIECEGKSHE